MKKPKDYIIFPLDVPTFDKARHYIRILANEVGMFKVGLELFIKSGPDIVKFIHDSGEASVFLDLKLHDIPATVERAAQVIGEMGVRFATVHCGESLGMLESAVKGSNGKTGILGVTVLTSASAKDIEQAGFKDEYVTNLASLVVKRAGDAKKTGCVGVVCSGLEAGMIKQTFGPDFVTVTPGIRPLWDGIKKDDQHRVTTPAQAVKNGSDYIVIGRPVRDAENPVQAARMIADEIESVL
ncbi:MAG: orotidine-5'-phosphate decarboxylase [Desulfobacteraceae bacterium]|nr:orotidine-5'-phosphate decarboxylase [Desulfobacteraceae bacterium]